MDKIEELKYYTELTGEHRLIELKIKKNEVLSEHDYYILFIFSLLTDEAK